MSEEKITGLEFLKDMPKTNDLVSSYGSVNLEQLNNVMKRLKKIPNYDELLKDNEKLSQENKQLKEDLELEKKTKEKFITDLSNMTNKSVQQTNILTELEQYLIYKFNTTQDTIYCDDLIKLKELKEKYNLLGDKE